MDRPYAPGTRYRCNRSTDRAGLAALQIGLSGAGSQVWGSARRVEGLECLIEVVEEVGAALVELGRGRDLLDWSLAGDMGGHRSQTIFGPSDLLRRRVMSPGCAILTSLLL